MDRLQSSEERVNINSNVPNFISPMESSVLPEVMRCFIIENAEEKDFPELRNSAAKTLSTLINAGTKETIDAVANGTFTCLKSSNPWHRQASAVLLSTICESPDS